MLNEKEKRELKQLLILLPEKELLSLKDTVTSKLIRTQSEEETIEAILTYSESVAELLSRKKVSRPCIFQYLAKKKVSIPGNAGKSDLIEKVLQLLGYNVTESDKLVKDENDCSNEATKTDSDTSTETTLALESPNTEEQNLALQFATWFYNQLNSNNPCLGETPSEHWGPQNFWNDCKLVLQINITAEDRMEEFEGADLVSERLLNMARKEFLVFNPNLEYEGTRGNINWHGQTMVVVCGTLHQGDEFLGIFKQSFVLIRDPMFQNNWKIMFTKLFIQQKGVIGKPVLGHELLQALTTG